MKRKRILILLSPLALLGVLYGGGYIGQFLANYQSWQTGGGSPGDGTAPAFPSFQIAACFKAAFVVPYGLYGIFLCLLLFLLLFAFVMKLGLSDAGEYDRERNLIYSRKGTYGTSGFMEPEELHDMLEVCNVEKCTGIILGELEGKVVALPEDTKLNHNFAVYGASGSMKSRTFIRNMALQCIRRGESMICTDPKSELYEDLALYAESQGYAVRVLNLVHPENSDSWNCLGEVKGSELMAQLFADTLIKNTGGEKSDHFWDNGELNLLKSLVLYVDHAPTGTAKTMAEVMQLITIRDEAALNKIFEALPMTHPAKGPYRLFQQASETVRTGIIIGLGTRLQVFQNQLIQEITSHDEIDLTLPGREKCAYFCVTSDQDSAFDCISSLFFSFLFIKLIRFADQSPNGKLPVPVHIIGDEWPNIGTVPDLPKKVSTIRSRDLSLVCCFQNLPQLQNRYPFNQWQEILGNCDCSLFLGCTDPTTASFVSDRTGEVSVCVDSKSQQLGTWRISNYTPEYRQTNSTGKRKLLTMDEVLRLPMQQALVILRGQKVLKVNKFDYTKHPDAKKLVKRKAVDHIPEWRKRQELADQKEVVSNPGMPEIHLDRQEPRKSTQRRPKLPKVPPIEPVCNERFEESPASPQQTTVQSKVTQIQKEDILS